VCRGAEYRADAFAAELIGYQPTIAMVKKLDVLKKLKSWYFRDSTKQSGRKGTEEEDTIPPNTAKDSAEDGDVGDRNIRLIGKIKKMIVDLYSTQPTLENRVQALIRHINDTKVKNL
jgi:Zn-dependent protease with chaperone function